MKLTSIVFCLALLGGALTSCIDEDIDDCFSINSEAYLSYAIIKQQLGIENTVFELINENLP